MDTSQNSARHVVLLAVANVVVGVAVPLVIDVFQRSALSVSDEILLGVMLFCAGSLLESLYFLAALKERAVREDQLWDVHEPVDSRLASIRKSLRTLESGVEPKTDIFLKYFHRKVHEVESSVRQTANTHELRVDSGNLDLSEPLLRSLTGLPTDVIRIVHLLSHNDDLFNPHEAQWFNTVLAAVQAGKVVEVRRVLVAGTPAEEEYEGTKRLLRFHTHTPGYDYRLVSASHFGRLARAFRLQGEFVDFGLYGERYLFRGVVYEPDDFVGVYSRETTTIERYKNLFDACWSAPGSRTVDPTTLTPISTQEFFAPLPGR